MQYVCVSVGWLIKGFKMENKADKLTRCAWHTRIHCWWEVWRDVLGVSAAGKVASMPEYLGRAFWVSGVEARVGVNYSVFRKSMSMCV